MSAAIQIENLSYCYRSAIQYSLKNVSFQVQKGEIFGLLGTNGAGKSTAISVLCGLLKPTSGFVKVLDFELPEYANQLKSKIGVVPQDIALYPELTARENLRFFGGMYDLSSNELKLKIDYYLEKLGLSQFANRSVGKFSGGMKRRVNLIAGILHDPQLLFLDEPTVGIDIQSKIAIRNLLIELKTNNKTIVYTSHDLDEAQSLCDSVLLLDVGEVILSGNTSHIIEQNNRSLHDVFLSKTGNQFRD